MRVLVTCLSRSWGGMEMFTVTFSELLSKNGYNVCLACLRNSRIDFETTHLNIQKIIFNSSSAINPTNIIRLVNYLRHNRIDLIHSHFSKDLWLIIPSLKFLHSQIPVILTKHLASFIVKNDLLHRWIYRRLNAATAISKAIQQNLIETTPLSSEKIVLLHNCIDLEKFNPTKYSKKKIRVEFNIDENEFVFGLISRLSPGKGHIEVVRAAKNLDNQIKGLKFIFVGSSEKDEEYFEVELKKMINEFLLNEYFIFTGFRKDVPEFLATFDAFLFPSRDEAFGIALIEAMAMGKPNIVCKAGGVLDIVVENETSLLFERGDIETLTNHIINLKNNKTLRMKLGKCSSERAKDFSLEKYQIQIDKLYSNLLLNKKSNSKP